MIYGGDKILNKYYFTVNTLFTFTVSKQEYVWLVIKTKYKNIYTKWLLIKYEWAQVWYALRKTFLPEDSQILLQIR